MCPQLNQKGWKKNVPVEGSKREYTLTAGLKKLLKKNIPVAGLKRLRGKRYAGS